MALAWPVTPDQVRVWMDVQDTGTDDSLDQACESVVAYVPTIAGLRGFWTDEEFVPPADVILGAIMLVARWHARRGSALGTTGYVEFGSGFIMRHDPDIGRMLRLGPQGSVFAFGAPSLPAEEES